MQIQCKCKKDYSSNPSTCICENSKYLKSIADTSVTECNQIIIVMDTTKYYSNKEDKYYSNKKNKYYRNKYYEYCFNKLSW